MSERAHFLGVFRARAIAGAVKALWHTALALHFLADGQPKEAARETALAREAMGMPVDPG